MIGLDLADRWVSNLLNGTPFLSTVQSNTIVQPLQYPLIGCLLDRLLDLLVEGRFQPVVVIALHPQRQCQPGAAGAVDLHHLYDPGSSWVSIAPESSSQYVSHTRIFLF